MQPQPLSEEKPVGSVSVLLILTENESAEVALGSTDFGIGSKPDLYVIQNFAAMSSVNPGGHPFSSGSSSPAAAAAEDERLLEADAGGVSGAFAAAFALADGFDAGGGGGLWLGDDTPVSASWPACFVVACTASVPEL
jgi:hypothetical protein